MGFDTNLGLKVHSMAYYFYLRSLVGMRVYWGFFLTGWGWWPNFCFCVAIFSEFLLICGRKVISFFSSMIFSNFNRSSSCLGYVWSTFYEHWCSEIHSRVSHQAASPPDVTHCPLSCYSEKVPQCVEYGWTGWPTYRRYRYAVCICTNNLGCFHDLWAGKSQYCHHWGSHQVCCRRRFDPGLFASTFLSLFYYLLKVCV